MGAITDRIKDIRRARDFEKHHNQKLIFSAQRQNIQVQRTGLQSAVRYCRIQREQKFDQKYACGFS